MTIWPTRSFNPVRDLLAKEKERNKMSMSLQQAMEAVEFEVMRATRKFPPFNSPHEGFAVLLEEVDELWDEVKANRPGRQTEEAVQVGAMAVRFLMDQRA